jgi:hypothetical protein
MQVKIATFKHTLADRETHKEELEPGQAPAEADSQKARWLQRTLSSREFYVVWRNDSTRAYVRCE